MWVDQNWTIAQWKKVAWSEESHLLLHHKDGRLRVCHLPGEYMAPGSTMGRRQAGFMNGWRNYNKELNMRGCWLGLQNSLISPIEHQWDVLDEQVQSMEAPPLNFQDIRDPLLTSCCQIKQHNFRGLVESRSWQVRAVLPAQYWAGVHNVIADRCNETSLVLLNVSHWCCYSAL